MKGNLFRPGGPLKARPTGNGKYSLSVPIPKDKDGRLARECTDKSCSPGYFKITPGTGIVDGHELAFCPYCRRQGPPSDFVTTEQMRYAKDMAEREVHAGINDMFGKALGIGPSGKRKIGGGLVSIEMSYKPARLPYVRRPFEDEVRRDVVCPLCTLDHTVFGLATWCADCGGDIFLTHVEAELEVTRKMLCDVSRREQELGRRVAAKDLENCLEDAVSIFEAANKALVRRALSDKGESQEAIEARMKRLGNAFQSIERCWQNMEKLFGLPIPSGDLWNRLSVSFEKRHPVAHNLGVVDRKYLERAQIAEREGREVRVTEPEIDQLLRDVFDALVFVHGRLCPPGGRAVDPS